jgi:hypothetical protein
LTLTVEEINALAVEMEEESKAIKTELYKMCWYMRGSLSVDQAFMLDYQDREIIAGIIEKNLETTKETRLPFF